MSARETGTIKIWCHKCKDYYEVSGYQDEQGAFHVEKADIDTHRAIHS